ncbi:MAG: hypothetical protein AABY22_36405 [Nanoarchaeota archaeon]
MKCQKDNFTTSNKKSFANHVRWHRKLISKSNFIGINKAEKNGQWKGNKVGYHALHEWIKKRLPKPNLCVNCKLKIPYDLANISGEYKRELTDWEWLCRSCHMIKDNRLKTLHQKKRKEKIKLICKECNEIYEVEPSRSRISHFCSKKCKSSAWKNRKYWEHLFYV